MLWWMRVKLSFRNRHPCLLSVVDASLSAKWPKSQSIILPYFHYQSSIFPEIIFWFNFKLHVVVGYLLRFGPLANLKFWIFFPVVLHHNFLKRRKSWNILQLIYKFLHWSVYFVYKEPSPILPLGPWRRIKPPRSLPLKSWQR